RFLVLVQEVFYAREIDYSFSTQAGIGASLAAQLTAQKGVQQKAASQGGEVVSGATTNVENKGTPESTKSSSNDLKSELDALSKKLEELNSQLSESTSPGIKAQVISVSERGVTLRQTFSRPIAIGYRRITLKPEPLSTGDCHFSGVATGTFDHPTTNLSLP